MTVKTQKMVEDLKLLKKAHDAYRVVDEEKRGRLLEACKPIINRLVDGGMDVVFVETLLIGGKDFLESLYGEGNEVAEDGDVSVIFG